MTGDTKKQDLGIQPRQLNKEDLIKREREVVGLKEKRMKSSNSTTTLFNNPDVAVLVPELRANHLARKYCLKWQAFVLKQKRNAIRALVHCKYHQYQRTWSIWLNMMGVEIEERRKYDMAAGYANILLVRIAFDGLASYYKKRMEKSELKRLADAHCQIIMIREFIGKWHHLASMHRLRSSLMKIAVFMSDKSSLLRHLRHWRNSWSLKEREFKHNAIAQEANIMLTLRKPFLAWKKIALKYQRLGLFHDYTISQIEARLKRKSLVLWKQKTKFVLETVNNTEKAINVDTRNRLLNILKFWLTKTQKKQRDRNFATAFEQKRNQRGKCLVLNELKKLLITSMSATRAANTKILAQSYRNWRLETAASRENKFQASLERGKRHHSTKIVGKTFLALLSNAREGRLEKRLNRSASVFATRVLFSKWARLADLKREQSLNESAATLYNHLTVLNQSWSCWKQAQDDNVFKERLVLMAIRFRKKMLMKKSFQAMMEKRNSILCEGLDDLEATRAAMAAKARLIFIKWARKTNLTRQIARNVLFANRFHAMVLLKSSWINWGKAVIRRKQSLVKSGLTQAIYERNHLKKHFYALLIYTRFRNRLKSTHSKCQQSIRNSSQSTCLKRWRNRLQSKFLLQLDARCFHEDQQKTVLRDSIGVWFFQMKRARSLRKRLERQILFAAKDLLCSSFFKWYQRYCVVCEKRSDLDVAVSFHEASILQLSVQSWICILKHRKWTKYNTNMAIQYHNQRILKPTFFKWHSYFSDWRSKYIRRHVLPLALSGLCLCKKAFGAWRTFVSEKKKMAKSIEDAKTWHKKMLIKDAIHNWFHAAQQLAWEAQANSGLTENQVRVALKYGVRWRRIAFAASLKRPQKSNLTSSSRMQLMYMESEMGFGPIPFQPRIRAEPRYPLFLESAVKKVIQPPVMPSTPVFRIDSKLDMEEEEGLKNDTKMREDAAAVAKEKEEKIEEQKKLYCEIKAKVAEIEFQLKEYCETQPLLSLQKQPSNPKIDFATLLQERGRFLDELNKCSNSVELVQNHVL